MAAAGPHVGDELGRIAAGRVGGGVDVDVGVLARDRDHLLGPRVADVAADDRQLGEVERDLVDVGDRPAGLRRAQRAGVADLRAERDAELDARGVERVEAAVGRRRLPQPGQHAQALEAVVRRRGGAARGRRPSAGARSTAAMPAGGRVPRHRARRPRRCRSAAPRGPCQARDHGLRDAGRVERLEGDRERDRSVGSAPAGPAAQRGEHVVREEAAGSGAGSRRRSSSGWGLLVGQGLHRRPTRRRRAASANVVGRCRCAWRARATRRRGRARRPGRAAARS